MSQSNPQQKTVERLWRTVQQTSIYLLLGAIFAIPGLVITYVVAPYAVGYFLIGAAAMITHVVMRSLDQNQSTETDIDFSKFNRSEALLLVGGILMSAIIGVSVKLWIAAGLATFVSTTVSEPVLALFVAMAFPVIDRKIASTKWYLSASSVAAMVPVVLLVRVMDIRDHMSKNTLKENSLRFSI